MTLLDIRKEAQVANQLCWAAVSTMAVSAFDDPELDALSQGDIVILEKARIKTLAERNIAKMATPVTTREKTLHNRLSNAASTCANTQNCNSSSLELWLFDVKSTRVTAGKVLTPEHFRKEIEDRARPVAIRWEYQGKKPANGRIRTGDHSLIIMGYNSGTGELRVFDPWPAISDPDPVVAPHEKWIPYSLYLNPESAEGMDAVAKHEFDEYKMRRAGESAPTGYPALDPVPPTVAPGENSVTFGREIRDLPESIDKVMRTHVVRNSSGRVIQGPYRAGAPIPIVVIEASELVAAEHDIDSLFVPETSAVIVPVLDRKGALIDSIQMLHEPRGWRAGGYSNNKIASLLSQAREMHGAERRDPRGFYLVSMPELSTFYVAHGFRENCVVAGLSRGSLRNLRGARQEFSKLIKSVRGQSVDRPR